MKRGRNLSVAERKHLENMGLKPQFWMISKKLNDIWVLVSKKTGKPREIKAP